MTCSHIPPDLRGFYAEHPELIPAGCWLAARIALRVEGRLVIPPCELSQHDTLGVRKEAGPLT